MPSGNPTFFAPPGERMGHRWSQQEENYVFARFSHGDSVRDIANQIGRGQSSVTTRLQAILGIPSDMSPLTVRSLAEGSGYLMHQATFMDEGSNRRRSPNPLSPVAQDLLPGGRPEVTETGSISASQRARIPIPSFSRFDFPPSSTTERSRTATEVNTARSLTIEDIRRAGAQLDQSMTVRQSPQLVDAVINGSLFTTRAVAPHGGWPGPATASATSASTQAPPRAPVRQPFSKHQQQALIATLRELRGQGSQATLDAVARAIATQNPGFDIEAFKTSCRELAPA